MRIGLLLAGAAAVAASASAALSTSPGTAPAVNALGAARTAAPAPQPVPAVSRHAAPAFNEPLLGTPRASSGPAHFTGEVVVIAFWSSWCAPCQAELRQLQRAWESRPEGTRFLGVDVDDSSSDALALLRSQRVTFPNVADAGSTVAAGYGIAGTPTIVLIDRSGREAAVAIGPTPAGVILRLIHQVAVGSAS